MDQSAILKETAAEVMRHYQKANTAFAKDAITLAEAHLQAANVVLNHLVSSRNSEMRLEMRRQ